MASTIPGKNAAAARRDPRDSGKGAAPEATKQNPLAPPGASGEHPPTTSGDAAPKPRQRKKLDEEKVSVTVHTPFKLTDDDGTQHHYHAGTQDVPRSHADHWYAKHHLDLNED